MALREPPPTVAQTFASSCADKLGASLEPPPGNLQVDLREPPPQVAQTFKWHCANLRLQLRKPSPLVAQPYWGSIYMRISLSMYIQYIYMYMSIHMKMYIYLYTCACVESHEMKPSKGKHIQLYLGYFRCIWPHVSVQTTIRSASVRACRHFWSFMHTYTSMYMQYIYMYRCTCDASHVMKPNKRKHIHMHLCYFCCIFTHVTLHTSCLCMYMYIFMDKCTSAPRDQSRRLSTRICSLLKRANFTEQPRDFAAQHHRPK